MKGHRTHPTASAHRRLIVSAWSPELAFLRANLDALPGFLRQRVSLGTVGVGLVEAAMGTTKLIETCKPDALLLIGTAGVYPSASEDFPLGGAALARNILLLAETNPGKHCYLPSTLPSRARCSPTQTRALQKVTQLRYADVACPLGITSTAKAATGAGKLSGCDLENLEAFAVARAAIVAKIPFTAILGITNHVGASGHREWKKYAKQAVKTACRAVLDYLTSPPSPPAQ